MCRQFNARTIFALDADTNGLDHDNAPYSNPDYHKGSIFCIDDNGFVYAYHAPFDDDDLVSDAWPKATISGIELYRDYWRYVYDANETQGAPYFRVIQDAPHRVIRTA